MGRPKKFERFSISRHRNASGSISWRVSGTTNDGKRIRENFKEQHEARERRAELDSQTAGGRLLQRTTLTPEQLSDAETAFSMLDSSSLSQTISQLSQWESRVRTLGISFEEAVRFCEVNYRADFKETNVLTARARFLASKKDLSPKSLRFYEDTTSCLLKPDPNRHLHTISVDELEAILGKFANKNTQKAYRRGLGVFFGWAMRHHFCRENPCERLDRIAQERTEIAVLSLEEVRRLLRASVVFQEGVMASAIAIALFAGLRPSELNDLSSTDVGETEIKVSGGKLRRKLKRRVPIPDNLRAWLKKYPFQGMPAGKEYKLRKLKKATNAVHWVQDILRHTSITFQAERNKDDAKTAYHNGTSQRMIDSHYRQVLENPTDAERFWKITPDTLDHDADHLDLAKSKKISWPSVPQLTKLLAELSISRVAAEIGVSDVGLRKHCKKHGIAVATNYPPNRKLRTTAT